MLLDICVCELCCAVLFMWLEVSATAALKQPVVAAGPECRRESCVASVGLAHCQVGIGVVIGVGYHAWFDRPYFLFLFALAPSKGFAYGLTLLLASS